MGNHPNRGRNRPCRNPKVAEIRRLQQALGLTNAQCAALVCASLRAWESWVADEDSPNHRPMPASSWRLLQYEIGRPPPPHQK